MNLFKISLLKKVNMKNKRGLSNIMIVLFLIIISIILISVTWSILKEIIEDKSEIYRKQTELVKEDIYIRNVEGDFSNPEIINIILTKGPGKRVLVNVSGGTTMEADIVSVVDLSLSMAGSKITEAKTATKSFIDSILTIPENQMGLVGYSTSVDDSDCHDLSNDAVSLKNKVDNWALEFWTCICCGINKGIEQLATSENIKAMVVMSDGDANRECAEQGTGNAKQDAIQAAADAYNNHEIKVYSVGFGSPDETTLQSIAAAGDGAYYFADVSELEDIYTQISEEIKEYASIELFDHLKIIFYSETESYEKKITELPIPLETKTYEIDLTGKITTLVKIEVYAVAVTESGDQVIKLLDVWEVE